MKHIGLAIFLFLFKISAAQAICPTEEMIDPINDTTWDCMYPMGMVGMTVGGGKEGKGTDMSSGSGTNKTAICECMSEGVAKVGVPFSFWEPTTMIEVVTDAWCMPAMGTDMGGAGYDLTGSKSNDTTKITRQAHYITFPALKLLDMYYDIPCIKNSDEFDYALLTEVLAYWQSDTLATLYFSESVLFANPASQLACTADAAAILAGLGVTTDTLYWCLGSTGSTYPLAGSIRGNDDFQASAALASRTIFLLGRMGALQEYHPKGCFAERKWIWNKSRYKYHLAMPFRVDYCTPIGSDAFLQTPGAGFPDNKVFMIFRKVDCCTWGD